MNENLHRVIGIDLGTTYSAVAAYNQTNEQTEIIANREEANSMTTPSVVSLDPMLRKVIVGRAAKRNIAYDPQNTIIEIKREMGEEFRPETLDKFQARGIFRAKENGYEGDPVKVKLSDQWFMPQEVSAFILMRMKEIAEQEIGQPVLDAVITVPAYFTEKQKRATQEAALLAGLYPRQLIPEPTAAAICYGVDQLEPTRKVYMVYDLGGGTFDVSIITVEDKRIEVIATSGDPRLGGGDFDDAIRDWALEELRQKYKMDVTNDPAAKAIIKLNAERIKINLSTFEDDKLALMELNPQNPPVLELTRQKFEELIDSLLDKSLSYVDTAIKAAETTKGFRRDDIDAILLVGGSSKIPKVKVKLLDYFQKDESFVRTDLDPDAVVARGAALLALRFAPSEPPFEVAKLPDNAQLNTIVEQELNLTHITEHSLGIGIQDNLFSKIIDQGTNIPISVTRDGFVNSGPGEFIEVRVYQGEGTYVFDNALIGNLVIGRMEPKPEGHHKFEVTFSLDENGLLSMTVHHINEGKRYQARFDQKTGIGGSEALGVVRNKLVQIFSPLAGAPVRPDTTPYGRRGTYQVPPPGSQYSSERPGLPPLPVPAANYGATAQPSYARQAAQPPANAYGEAAQSQVMPPEPVAPSPVVGQPVATAANPTTEPTREVPEQFKSIVRRAQKQLLKQTDPKLLAAFNAFVASLNEGKPEDELVDLGDDLEDVYQECRRSSGQ
jgi:molecular chaperone DnaK (HSP70)